MIRRLFIISLFFTFLNSAAQDVRINDDSGDADQEFPAIAMHPNGPMVICWADERNGAWDVYMQLFTRRGMPFMGNLRVNDISGGAMWSLPNVAMDRFGQFTVVYQVRTDPSSRVYYRRFYANGAPKGPSVPISDDDYVFNPAIAMSPAGDFVIVWEGVYDIFARLFSPHGEEMTSEIRVNAPEHTSRGYPEVAMHEDGSFMVIWRDTEAGVGRIWGRLFDQHGNPATEPFEVSDPADDGNVDLFEPKIAAGRRGEYLVLWKNAANNLIYGRRIDAGGDFIGPQMIMTEDVYFAIFNINVVAHPEFDLYQFVWNGMVAAGYELFRNVFSPGYPIDLEASTIGSGYVSPQHVNVGMAGLFNSVYTWSDERAGNFDIYATWDGARMPMRTTAASGFDGMVPISWDPPYTYMQVRPYHIHRIGPDGTRQVIATVNPADRALPNQMLDYIDHDVVNGETYQYAVQLDGERDDQLFFVEATPSEERPQRRSQWAVSPPAIDGVFEPEEWMNGMMGILEPVSNPQADGPVFLIFQNDSSYLYICVLDMNDDHVDPGNSLGIVFDEDHDGRWESSPVIGEGMLTLTNENRTFVSFAGDYPNDLHFSAPQSAENIDFVVNVDDRYMVYECRIDLQASPLNASEGDTIGLGLWIKDPGRFYGWGQGNAGEWPAGALWDAAETLGDLILAKKPETYLVPFNHRYAIDMAAEDVTGDGQPELIALTRNADIGGIVMVDTGQVDIFQWRENRFVPIYSTEPIEGLAADLRIVDLDVDGRPDILFTCAGLKMLHNTGDSWELVDLIHDALLTFAAVDFNDDALPDIVAYRDDESGPRISLYKQGSGLNFDFSRDLEDSEGLDHIETIDWNGDGKTDLLFGSRRTGRLLLLQNDGLALTPVFEDSVFYGVEGLAIGDFDLDGWQDFAVSSDSVFIFHNRRNGEFGMGYAGSDIGDCFGLDVIDIDRDSYPELIAAPIFGGLFLYHNMGAMDFDEIDAGYDGQLSFSAAVAAGDFDGNGLIDIAFASNPIEVLFDAALRFGVPTRVSVFEEAAPTSFRLLQNYPNPFNPTTTIAFDVPRATNVELTVYDMLGRQVAVLVNERYEAGRYKATFDASQFASGVYFYRIRMGDFEQTRKMLLVR